MDTKKTRSRSVRLTEEGRKRLVSALDARWLKECPGVRPTGESKAEFFGLSLGTTKKLLRGDQVDLATLELAFLKLNLRLEDSHWSRSLLHPDEEDLSAPPEEAGEAEPPDPPHSQPESVPAELPRKRSSLLIPSALLGVLLLALMAFAFLRPTTEEVIEAEHEKANVLIAQGTRLYNEGSYREAETAFSSAMEIAVKRDLTGLAAESSRMMGDVASALGDLKAARTRYLTALRLRESLLGFRTLAGKSYPAQVLHPLHEALGVVESRLGNWSEAERHLNLALSGFRQRQDTNGIVMALRDLGALAYRRRKFSQSLALLDEALASLGPSGAQTDLAWDVKARRTLALADLGRSGDAVRTLTECLQHWEKKCHVKWQAETRMQLAHAEDLSGRRRAALEHIEVAAAQFRQVGDARNLKEAVKAAAQLRAYEAQPRASIQTAGL